MNPRLSRIWFAAVFSLIVMTITTLPGVAAVVTFVSDHGDAPVSYGAADHTIGSCTGWGCEPVLSGPYLGACVDNETGPVQSANADGDDIDVGERVAGTCATAGDDEDGVTFSTPLMVGDSSAGVDVVLGNDTCTLDAWMDFDGDGAFGAGEQIFTDQALSNGSNALSFAIPSDAAAGSTIARFRCSTETGLGPIGPAANGEAEDYQVTLETPAPQVTDATTTIDTQTKSGLTVDRNPLAGAEITHFQITAITDGELFQNDGTTPIADGDFITVAQGQAGLRFTPDTGFLGEASFQAQSATGDSAGDPGGDKATATIQVVRGNVSEPIDPQTGGTLVYTGSGTSQPVTVTLEIPAGSVTQTITIVYSETQSSDHPAPATFDFAGQTFTLDAYLGAQLLLGYEFNPPFTLTLDYDPAELGDIDEATLELRYWNGAVWSTDRITLVKLDTEKHQMVVSISHLTEFALIGHPEGGEQAVLFLPLVFKAPAGGPDLVVEALSASSDSLQVVIANRGNAPTTDDFWVDAYFNPNQIPSLNHQWEDIAAHGAAWGVTKRLDPGESLTLTLGDKYFYNGNPSYPVGATVYAFVDSINYATDYGNVLEVNENNNLSDPVISGQGEGSPPDPVMAGSASGDLPDRDE